MLKKILIAVIILSVASVIYAADQPGPVPPMPDSFKIDAERGLKNKGENLPPEVAAFLGHWGPGTWSQGSIPTSSTYQHLNDKEKSRQAKVIVVEINPNPHNETYSVSFLYGISGEGAGWFRRTGTIQKDPQCMGDYVITWWPRSGRFQIFGHLTNNGRLLILEQKASWHASLPRS